MELRLPLGAEHGRADPAAVITLAPLLALARALHKGWAQAADADLLLVGTASHPLAHALRRSMRALALAGALTAWVADQLAGHPVVTGLLHRQGSMPPACG